MSVIFYSQSLLQISRLESRVILDLLSLKERTTNKNELLSKKEREREIYSSFQNSKLEKEKTKQSLLK